MKRTSILIVIGILMFFAFLCVLYWFRIQPLCNFEHEHDVPCPLVCFDGCKRKMPNYNSFY